MIATIIKSSDEVTPSEIAPLVHAHHTMNEMPVGTIEELSDWCSKNWPSAPMISLLNIKDFDLQRVLVSHAPAGYYAILMTAALSTQLQAESVHSELYGKVNDASLTAFVVTPNKAYLPVAGIIDRIYHSCRQLGVFHDIVHIRKWILRHSQDGNPKVAFAENADYEVTNVVSIKVDDDVYQWLVGMHMFNAFCSQDEKIKKHFGV